MTATPEQNFAGRLVRRLSEASCLIDAASKEIVSACDVPRLIVGYAAGFRSVGLEVGNRLLVGCALSPASTLAYLGAMYAGLVPVPVAERTLAESCHILLQQTGATAIWTEKPVQPSIIGHNKALHLHGNLAKGALELPSPAPREETDLAVLVATSGSTGIPRFVLVSHGNLTANTEAIIRSQRLARDERAMLILPINSCFGASVLHTHLYQGGGVVFDRRFMFPEKVLRAIAEHSCTTFAGVPTAYNILLQRSNIRSHPMPSLRRFLQAGGSLAPHKVMAMRQAVPSAGFFVMYGQTEATARISCLDPDHLEQKLGSAGRPLDNLTVRVIDENGCDLLPGQVGEILVKGPSVSRGYLNDPEETDRVFQNGWLHTRDLGHIDEEGYLWIHGRMGSFLKMRGVRVSFSEVEARVAEIPEIYECAATAVAHPEAGEALVLYVVPNDGATNVVECVRRRLPSHWTCDSIRVVQEMPKTSQGKVSLAALCEG